jgi:hypothetical protein
LSPATGVNGQTGGGGNFNDSGGSAGDAQPYGGSVGVGGGNHPWMGGSGGAGNSGGSRGACRAYGCPASGSDGTGGLLMVFVRGNIIIGENGSIQSNGSNGGEIYVCQGVVQEEEVF